MELARMTFPEVEAVLKKGAVALWPVGATEAHGPHLPLNTDVLIATETCRRAAPNIEARLNVKVLELPALAFSITDYAAPFSGTITLPKATAEAYVRDVLLGTARQGVRAVCVVNAHLEPAHRFMLRDAVKAARPEAACPLVIADPADRRWVDRLTDEFRSGACHAGQYESSLVMAAEAEAVRDDLRRGLPRTDIDLMAAMQAGKADFRAMGADQAYFGAPADATLDEGHETYTILSDIVVTVIQDALTEQ